MHIDLAGAPLQLLEQRAILWPATRTLLLADVHLGKGAAFRRAGLAVPAGSTASDLARLDALVEQHLPERLLVLGDLVHAAFAGPETWWPDFDAFRARHPGLWIQVVRGNHDRGLVGAPGRWALDWVGGRLVEPPFVFAHEPTDDPRGYVLAGHLHPVLRLRSAADRARLPVFWLRARMGVLPSFGSFTGGHPIRPTAGERLVAVTPEGLIAVPASTQTVPGRRAGPAAWGPNKS